MNRQLVVLNPRAGRMQASRRLGELLPLLEGNGVVAELLETGAPGEAREAVQKRAGEFCRVVCIGGDGTLNEVISGMLDAGKDVPIGYVAAGSTNDFAASHGISRDILKAARDVASGVPVPIDVGSFNGRCFAYTASFGAFTRASYAAPQAVKNAVGHLAYIFEGIKDLTLIRPYAVTVEAEGETYAGEFIFGMAGNSTSMGGVLKLDPLQVDLHDGKFEVILVRKPEHIGQLIAAAVALQSRQYENELLCFFKAAHLRISAPGDMDWTLDGEFQPGAENIDIQNLHNAVRLILPRG